MTEILSISKKTAFSRLKVNDLVLFQRNNRIFTHRIIYKKGNYLIAKGDHNFKDDGKIYSKHILGKVTNIKRNNKIINPETIYLLQSTIYLTELKLIAKELNSKDINFVFLKGLPIHLFYEKTHPQRIYVDCDILLAKNQYQKALKIFTALGYKPLEANLKSSIKESKQPIEKNLILKL